MKPFTQPVPSIPIPTTDEIDHAIVEYAKSHSVARVDGGCINCRMMVEQLKKSHGAASVVEQQTDGLFAVMERCMNDDSLDLREEIATFIASAIKDVLQIGVIAGTEKSNAIRDMEQRQLQTTETKL